MFTLLRLWIYVQNLKQIYLVALRYSSLNQTVRLADMPILSFASLVEIAQHMYRSFSHTHTPKIAVDSNAKPFLTPQNLLNVNSCLNWVVLPLDHSGGALSVCWVKLGACLLVNQSSTGWNISVKIKFTPRQLHRTALILTSLLNKASDKSFLCRLR